MLQQHISGVHEALDCNAKDDPVIQYSWTFQCGRCNATLSNAYNLKRHISEIHKGIKYYAKRKRNQSYSAPSQKTLDNDSEKDELVHEVDHEKEESFEDQNKVVSKNTLGKRTDKKMKQKKFKCEKCGATLSCDYNLRRHISEIHNGVKYYTKRKPYKPNIASPKKTPGDQLEKDMMFHELETEEELRNDQDKPLSKGVFVNKTNKKTKQTIFECKICNASLSCDYNLKRHVSEVHNGVKYYTKRKPCNLNIVSTKETSDDQLEQDEVFHELDTEEELCNEQGKPLRKSVLVNNTNQKTEQTTFECGICNASLSCDYNLKRHVSEVHNGVKYYSKRKAYKRNVASPKKTFGDTSNQDELLYNFDQEEEISTSLEEPLLKSVSENKTNKNIKQTTFECKICNASLSCDYNLKGHISEVHNGVKYHTKTKPYKDKSVISNDQVETDELLQELKYEDEERFDVRDKRSLNKAFGQRTHKKIKYRKLKCEKCELILIGTDYNLRRHISEVHNGVKFNRTERTNEGNIVLTKKSEQDEIFHEHDTEEKKPSRHISEVDNEVKSYTTGKSNEHNIVLAKKPEQDEIFHEHDTEEKKPIRHLSEVHNRVKSYTTGKPNEHNIVLTKKPEQDEIFHEHDAEEKIPFNNQNTPKGLFISKTEKERKPKSFKCEICNASLSCDYNLRRHVSEIHKRVKFYKRRKSYKRYNDFTKKLKQDEIFDFEINHSIDDKQEYDYPRRMKNPLITCKYCGVTVKSKFTLERHLIEVHQCIRLNSRYRQAFNTKYGMDKQDDKDIKLGHVYPQANPRKCSKCEVPFSSAQSLGYHVYEMHRNEPPGKWGNNDLQSDTEKESESKQNLQFFRRQNIYMSCNKCDKIFTNVSETSLHYRNAHVKEPKLQVLYRSCIKRAKKHKVIDFFRCDTCNTVHKTVEKLKTHAGGHIGTISDNTGANKRSIPLKYLSARPETAINELTHDGLADKVNQLRRKLYKCKFCQKKFSSRDKLQNHMSLHTGKMTYSCFACRKSLLCQKYLIHHMKKHVDEHVPKKVYECNECKKQFSSVLRYKRHIDSNIHLSEGHLLCDICSKTFKSTTTLAAHRKTHMQIAPEFICNLCGAEFERKYSLQRHHLVHSGVTAYVCSVCSKTFKEKYELRRHSLIHNRNRERGFSCNLCSKSFFTNPQLKKHKRHVHMGERDYTCHLCEKSFISQSDLNIHFKTHTDERSQICEICGKGFRLKAHLRAHLRMHKGEKIWGCEKCGVRYTDKRSYNRHVERCTSE